MSDNKEPIFDGGDLVGNGEETDPFPDGPSQNERVQRHRVTLILEDHDKEIDRLSKLKADLPMDDYLSITEKTRNETIEKIWDILSAPLNNWLFEMRKTLKDELQIYKNGLQINDEMSNYAESLNLPGEHSAFADWDEREFGETITNLVTIRRTLLLGNAIVGPVHTNMIIEKMIDKMFRPRKDDAK